MKNFNLKIGGIKEMLSKDQMKKISGGYTGCENQSFEGAQHCSSMGGVWQRCYNDLCGVYYQCLGPSSNSGNCY
ncbi:hypothetical protein [Pedobacter jejuensis]|uniref:Bacteriocin n=1 Tax=Pedobacter jejuensis TaxID=1268550 RepID=A0A3N0BZP6_9SPHI|nr:hypothetical protein [Pedobacter jejuensis]RNL55414.1 hypothetical protein D7004_04860 [Pedobacter jejuensis]